LLAKESEAGTRIMIRLQGTKRPKCRITWSLLRRHCPELFESKVEQLERDMKSYLGSIDAKIAESVSTHVASQVEPRLDELWQRDETIAESVRQLARRVTLIVGPEKPGTAHGKAKRVETPRAPAQNSRAAAE
jgi:hypothetical protein